MTEQRAEYDAEGDLVQFNAPDFGVIPAELMCDQELSRNARLLGCLLWSYRNKDTGNAWPSQKTLADRLGVSVRSVQKWMAELRERKWMQSQHRISVDPTYRGNPGALIHILNWSLNKGKDEQPDVSNTNSRAGTTRTPTAQELTRELTKGTESGGEPHSSKNSQIEKTISKAEKALLDAAVYPRTITRLIRDFSEELILEKAQHWGGGELVCAIEEDWTYQPPRKKDHKKDKTHVDFGDFDEVPKYCPGGCGWGLAQCHCEEYVDFADSEPKVAPASVRGGKQTVGEVLGVTPPKVDLSSE